MSLDANESTELQFEPLSTEGLPAGRYECGLVTETEVWTESIVVDGEDLSLSDYASEDGTIHTEDLRDAVGDWQAGIIDADLLIEVIDAWQSGATVA